MQAEPVRTILFDAETRRRRDCAEERTEKQNQKLESAEEAENRKKAGAEKSWRQVGAATVREHLKRLRDLELEEQDRRGYLAQPQREEEFRVWDDAAAWPEG